MSTQKNQVTWFLWPFKAVRDFLAWIIKLIGRLVAVIIASPLGIPIMVLGFLLMVRGIF